MDSRDHVFASIRRNLAAPLCDDEDIDEAYQRLATHVLPKPKRYLVPAFKTALEALSGQVTIIKDIQEVVVVVLDALKKHNTHSLLMADMPLCRSLVWPEVIKPLCRRAQDGDKVALSEAYAGVAETGSIVLHSSPDMPASHNFLVDEQFIILPASKIKAHLEQVWQTLDRQRMPRTVNILTGPSRTGDVEQTIQIGAHGPLRFHVFILENA